MCKSRYCAFNSACAKAMCTVFFPSLLLGGECRYAEREVTSMHNDILYRVWLELFLESCVRVGVMARAWVRVMILL